MLERRAGSTGAKEGIDIGSRDYIAPVSGLALSDPSTSWPSVHVYEPGERLSVLCHGYRGVRWRASGVTVSGDQCRDVHERARAGTSVPRGQCACTA